MTQIQFENITDQMLANAAIHTKLIQESGELVILLQEFGLSFPGYNPVELLQLEDRCRHFIDFIDLSSKANTSKAHISKANISTVDQSTQYPNSLLSQELCVIVKCMIYHINVTVTYTKDCITILTSRKGEDVYVTYRLDFNYRSALNYSASDIRDFILEKVKGYSSSVDDLLPPDFEGFGFFNNDSSDTHKVRGAQPEHPKSEWFQVPDTN